MNINSKDYFLCYFFGQIVFFDYFNYISLLFHLEKKKIIIRIHNSKRRINMSLHTHLESVKAGNRNSLLSALTSLSDFDGVNTAHSWL